MQEHQTLLLSGWMREEENRGFKQHYDVYYIYHAAAIAHLAQAEIKDHLRYVELAQTELNAIRQILAQGLERAQRQGQRLRPQRRNPTAPPPIPNGDPT
jgi:hypothetical protein